MPLMVCAAADNNSPFNQEAAQRFLFLGQRALQQRNFDRAKDYLQQSANLGSQTAIKLLADFQQVVAEYNQQQGRRGVGITIERTKK